MIKTANITRPPQPTEHQEQTAFFQWLSTIMRDKPDVGLCYAVPNGGRRHIGTAVKLAAEGVKAGVPDICWPVPRYPYHGLYIEMKRSSGGRASREQLAWINRLRSHGYRVELCNGFDAARTAFIEYMNRPLWAMEAECQITKSAV
ncbi:MAG: VRR-NUC domain-containing protein [Desulfobacterales bacterium]|jgi:hypothetical protein|nr:VRR-NUC domain-containing protein [Desulfobacterales bacterium]